jgi:hypothetical protein
VNSAAARTALAYFTGQGWSAPQAAGIVANLVAESNLNPAAVGDGGAAYGIAQWHPDRQAGFAALIGKPIRGSTLEEQLAWVHAELQGTEKHAGDALSACTTAGEAAAVVCAKYERPADILGESIKRAKLAETILADSSAIPEQNIPTPTPERPAMLPLLLAPILQMIPELVGLFAKGERGQTNAKAAQVVVDAFTKSVPNASGPGDAIDKAAADPTVAAAAKAAVLADPAVIALTEVGGGVAAARQFDLAQQAMQKPFYQTSAVFWMSILLLPLVYWLVGSLIIGGYGQILALQNVQIPEWAQAILAIFGASWTGEARSGGFNLVIGLILGGICGVYYGVSVTQQRQQNPSGSNS